MRQTGLDMQSKYKETSQGGLAVQTWRNADPAGGWGRVGSSHRPLAPSGPLRGPPPGLPSPLRGGVGGGGRAELARRSCRAAEAARPNVRAAALPTDPHPSASPPPSPQGGRKVRPDATDLIGDVYAREIRERHSPAGGDRRLEEPTGWGRIPCSTRNQAHEARRPEVHPQAVLRGHDRDRQRDLGLPRPERLQHHPRTSSSATAIRSASSCASPSRPSTRRPRPSGCAGRCRRSPRATTWTGACTRPRSAPRSC